MKNSQRGFIVPILLIIIAVLLIGGGGYLYTQNQKLVESSQSGTQATSTPTAPAQKPNQQTKGSGTFKVLSPNGGERLVVGSTYKLSWTPAPNNLGTNFSLRRFNKSTGQELFPSVPLEHSSGVKIDGAWNWIIPENFQYKDTIINLADSNIVYKLNVEVIIQVFEQGTPDSVSDDSDGTFTIVNAVGTPSVTVLSPNGGERWNMGEKYPITWKTSGISNPADWMLNVELIDGPDAEKGTIVISKPLSNYNNTVSWQVPTNFRSGNYRVLVRLNEKSHLSAPSEGIGSEPIPGRDAKDMSDASFLINYVAYNATN